MSAIVTTCNGTLQTVLGKKKVMIYSEWLNDKVTIILLAEGPVIGVINDCDVERFAKEVSQTKEDYLHQLRCIFSGEDTDIEFVLKDDILEWSRPYWSLGQTTVGPLSDVNILTKYFSNLAEQHLSINTNNKQSPKCTHNTNNNIISSKLETMIRLNNDFKKDVYKRILPILNAKKKRIRELQEQIRKINIRNKSKFDATTDESGESEDSAISKRNIKHLKRKRLKSLTINSEDKILKVGIESNSRPSSCKILNSRIEPNKAEINNVESSKKEIIQEGSTSKNSQPETDATPDLVFSSEESECEIHLEDEEDVLHNKVTESKLNFEEEASEDDLF